jgi:lauroyl/myristoyl acyltransferase
VTGATKPRMGLRARWHARTAIYSPRVWALMIALDVLPWPWGEDLLAHLFTMVGLLRASRRRRTAAWAAEQPGRRSWHLAASLCAFLGRWTARSKFLGLRCPDDLRRHLVVEGEEYLAATSGGVILLAFHLGPPKADVALRTLGHRVTCVAGAQRRMSDWCRPAWRSLLESSPDLSPGGNPDRWLGVLYQARRILLEGGTVYIMADGGGRELFRVPLPGGPAIIVAGWLNLHRQTGARVLPVLTHLKGRTQIITIHPALPMRAADPGSRPSAWQETLTSLLEDYVRRFPEQCFGLVFSRRR